MATDSLSSEMDKMDVQGMRNPHVCSSAKNLLPSVLFVNVVSLTTQPFPC